MISRVSQHMKKLSSKLRAQALKNKRLYLSKKILSKKKMTFW